MWCSDLSAKHAMGKKHASNNVTGRRISLADAGVRPSVDGTEGSQDGQRGRRWRSARHRAEGALERRCCPRC
jgi:hypothetical protein